MEQELPVIRISVRNLVEFILREGDIDSRRGSGADKEAMQLGGKIHRKIQKSMGAGYRAEVTLKREVPCDGFLLRIEGRADGIIEEETGTVIDEIKGVLCDLEKIEEPVKVHLAQARCYACIYGREKGLDEMTVQMTYCQMETEEIRRFRETYRTSELEEWFQEIVKAYEKWGRFQIQWKEIRNRSAREIPFPFAYRPGQKDLAAAVYRTILRKKKLFIQAPTGVGKTMAAVFPAVKAVGENLGEKIFYLTARTIARTVAEQAFRILKEQNLRMKVITLTAKEKICFLEKAECNPEACPYARGHFDRVNDAVYELLTGTDDMSREVLEKQAEKFRVCPFEMSLDMAVWTDAVICDYNYVFDPNAHLKRFFTEGVPGEYLFLIDEAHNLVERGRQMYSASLYKEDFLAVRKLVKKEDMRLAKRLGDCNQILLSLKRECESWQVLEGVPALYLKLMNVLTALEDYLEECTEEEKREQVLDFYFSVRDFLNIYDRLDDNYVVYTELQEDGRFLLRLFCVNPAANLQRFLDCGNSTVFFSATLLPVQYYKKLLSTEPDDYAVYAPSPFPRENRLLVCGRDVSTRYTLRGEQMYRKYAGYIRDTVRARKGNYMAFFPSYRFMEEVYGFYEEMAGEDGTECILQSHFMNEEAREIFLETFEEDRDTSLVGFCVLGGIFSEGIDLDQEKLIGAFIIGTGLPQVCTEREILKRYFDGKGMRGFDYAYLYPGMNKVMQAAGRVIRTETDQGVILLLDERFLEKRCREIFPREWSDCTGGNRKRIAEKVEEFWRERDARKEDADSPGGPGETAMPHPGKPPENSG